MRSPCYKCLGTGRIMRSIEECSHTLLLSHAAHDLDSTTDSIGVGSGRLFSAG